LIVKVCGITRPKDAVAAVRAGADWIGINFWPKSSRFCTDSLGCLVADAARRAGEVDVVGVFVNATPARIREVDATIGLDRIQLHGDETPADCAEFAGRYMKAISMTTPSDIGRLSEYDCDVFLVDTPTQGYGGSGRTGDWGLAAEATATGRLVVLAGGLTPGNVAKAIRTVQPYGVDVASGVEYEPGMKDARAMARFVEAAKAAL
jgi:phosphoribosylanthranilate isomerase